MAFLLRPTTGHQSDLPLAFSRPQLRIGSPWPGGSILMTSAPMSPSSCPQNGPASSVPSSITRSPESGPGLKLESLVMRIVLWQLRSILPGRGVAWNRDSGAWIAPGGLVCSGSGRRT